MLLDNIKSKFFSRDIDKIDKIRKWKDFKAFS